MRKLILLTAAMTLSAGMWANSITYKATAALSYHVYAFDAGITSHTWDESSKVGVITFDGDVTTIGYMAFANCSSMTSMTLPNTITKIGEIAFMECTGLTTINIPNAVTTIGKNAFHKCMSLTSITIPNAVTEIGEQAFMNCYALTSVTFEGAACQNAIGTNVFEGVGQNETVTLTLPEDWNYDAAPESNTTAWYGGIFNSNLYSTDGATDKQAAIAAVTAIMGDYATTTYLQSLLAEEVGKINSAVNRHQVNERKQAAIERLTFAITDYTAGKTAGDAIGYARGIEEGKAEAKTELLGEMGEPCEDCPSIEVTKGDKTIKLYNPEKVEFGKE